MIWAGLAAVALAVPRRAGSPRALGSWVRSNYRVQLGHRESAGHGTRPSKISCWRAFHKFAALAAIPFCITHDLVEKGGGSVCERSRTLLEPVMKMI